MCRKAGVHVPEAGLPEGYGFVFFRAGDEKHWAEIEASVLEFKNAQEAEKYFGEGYLPHIAELEKRCVFIENDKGEKVATSMAWWDYIGAKRYPWLHWVAVKPDEQGKGLGKAIVSKATRLLLEIEGDNDFYLKTQTWSHRAVRIYEKLGWEMVYMKNWKSYSKVALEKAKKVLKRYGK
jgi:GNAT superfamily N-acetyltransferase